MKKLDTLLQGAVLSGAAARPRPGGEAKERLAGPDHVDAINRLFAEFELAYHNQFHKAYAREGSLALAKKYWLSRLSRFAPAVILRAARQIVDTQEFLPSLPAVISACENALSLFGLPAVRDAYVEACCAPEPKAAHRWSHPAVYHAARATGWFILATESETRALPLFEYHYRQLCRRVMEGERLDIELPKALTDGTPTPLPPEENQERLRALRAKLGI